MDHILKAGLIGGNLRHIREELYGLSQVETARLCGVSRATLRRVEDGVQFPSLPLLTTFGRIDARYVILADTLTRRDLRRFPLNALRQTAEHFRALDGAPDDFILAWYEKIAAELRLYKAIKGGTPPPSD